MHRFDNIVCHNCGIANNYQSSEICHEPDITYVICHICAAEIPIGTTETLINRQLEEEIPILTKGALVKIINEQHPWYGQIGLIADTKHKHYRIEVLGIRMWVPEHWVQTNE